MNLGEESKEGKFLSLCINCGNLHSISEFSNIYSIEATSIPYIKSILSIIRKYDEGSKKMYTLYILIYKTEWYTHSRREVVMQNVSRYTF